MNKDWLQGFIEGTGCFSVIIRKSPNQVGVQTIADFTLKLPLSQKPLLEKVQKFLGVGRIYESGNEATLKSTKLDDAKKLVAFFNKPFSGPKRKEFNAWKSVVERMSKGLHLNKEGVLEIARLRDSIHKKKLWNKKDYCSLRVEIDPCEHYQKNHRLPKGCRACMEKAKEGKCT